MSVCSRINLPSQSLDGKSTLKRVKGNGLDIDELARVTAQTVGRTIQARRMRSSISKEELASRMGRTRKYVTSVESGKHALAISEFKSFAAALGVDHLELAQDIFERIDTASTAIKILA